MNTNEHSPNEEQLTAYALGQLDEAAREHVDDELTTRTESRRHVDEVGQLAAALRNATVSADHPDPSEKLRRVVQRRLDQQSSTRASETDFGEKAKRRSWLALGIVGAAAACLITIVSVLLPSMQADREAVQMSNDVNDWLPAPYYNSDDVQYFPPGKKFRLQKETTSRGDAEVQLYDEVEAMTVQLPAFELHAAPKADLMWETGGRSALSGRVEREQLAAREIERHKLVVPLDPDLPDIGGEIAGGSTNSEQYDRIIENPFFPVDEKFALSTFSIDVDTASYSNVRRFLREGRLPPADAVRIEELINYFTYDYPQPQGDIPFSVNMETAECPWQPGHRLLRVGLKGKEIHRKERPPSNLVFLLDVSGSMSDHDKLPLLKESMKMLIGELDKNDRVTIVTYHGNAGLRLDATRGDQRIKLRDAIDGLRAGGSTHGSAGIQMAYDRALDNFIEDGVNRVILATDGDLNVGITDDDALVELIKEKAASGVFLTVLGFGTGNLKDSKMEKLADNGNGAYAYIDSMREGRKVLVEQISGSLITIAKDVKIQIEFNPAEVAAYRLIGYENRLLAKEDFDDDTKDAGEIGAGHTVTALYELVPAGAKVKGKAGGKSGTLKYQKTDAPKKPDKKLSDAASSGELLTLWLRYKQPDADESDKLELTLKDSGTKFNRASKDFQFAASVASFGMLLRGSKYRGSSTLSAVEEIASGSLGKDPHGYRTEFLDLVRRAAQLLQ